MSDFKLVNHSANRFSLENADGQEVGYLNYHVDAQNYYLDYVYVSPNFRGQSVGQHIVKAAMDASSAQSLKPVPICGYAKTVMQRMSR